MKRILALLMLGMFAVAAPAFAADTKQSDKMAECNAKTKGMSKDEANKARSECMKAKPEKSSKDKMAECNAKTKGMSKDEANKARSECMKS